MVDFRLVGNLGQGFVRNLTDLTLGQVGDQLVLVGATHAGGGVTIWTVDDAGRLATLRGTVGYPDLLRHMAEPQAILLDRPSGVSLVTGGLTWAVDSAWSIRPDGSIGGWDTPFNRAFMPGDLLGAGSFGTRGGLSLLYSTRHDGPALATWRQWDDGRLTAIDLSTVPPGLPPDAQIDSVVPLRIGGVDLLISASTRGNFLSAHRVLPDGTLAAGEFVGLGRGTGFNGPRDICAVEVEGKHYLVVSSAYSSSLTTVRILPGGGLVPVDHVIDERTTRFQSATVMESVTIDGRSFVVAGGADDGLSLFTITPDGRLVHVATVADSDWTRLQDVSALAIRAVDGKIAVFAGSATETGVTQFLIDVGRIGLTVHVGPGGLDGTAQDDLIQASIGTTLIRGGDGDDILIAGPQSMTMVGGAGADVFMPVAFAGRLTIRDFEPGIDRLDMSMMGMVRSTDQIRFIPVSGGIRMKCGDAVIELRSSDGRSLGAAQFSNAMFPIAHYQPADVRTTINGTPRSELLSATRGGTTIYGWDGNDTLSGSLLEDFLSGGNGNDRIIGRDGDDTLWGGAGSDVIRGGGMNDLILAGDGFDLVLGEDGHDRIAGQGRNDTLWGGLGNDSMNAGMGDDMLFGEQGDDRLFGMGGNDRLSGGPGDDLLLDLEGNNVFRDESGFNQMFGGAGRDIMFGGVDTDILRPGLGDDVAAGGGGNDKINGAAGNDLLYGDDGQDTILGAGGDDWLFGGAGSDLIFGGLGDDRISAGDGDDYLFGEQGRDILLGGTGNDTLRGQGDDDRLYAGDGDDRLLGGIGADTLAGDEGRDLLLGEAGADILIGGGGDDTLDGSWDDDQMWGNTGNDLLIGGHGADRMLGGSGHDTLSGGDGDDLLSGQAGRDSLSGGGGRDVLRGSWDDDFLWGDDGDDTLDGGPGSDVLAGGAGADVLIGGGGADVFVFANAADSTPDAPDVITDFLSGESRLDLTALDVRHARSGMLTGRAGELAWAPDGADLLVWFDADGDGAADLSLRILGLAAITEADLMT